MEKDLEIENIDYVICQLCGKKAARIYGRHLTCTHKMSASEYRILFPDAKTVCLKDNEKFHIKGGEHMKTEKYKKLFSEKMSGDNNRNSKSKTTEKQRKERSPFAKEFYESRGMKEEHRSIFNALVSKNRTYNTTIAYYMNKGFSEFESKILLKDRQTTFSLEKCIKKYGEIEGTNKWKLRQEKWKIKVFNKDSWIGKGTSILSIEIIDKILLKIKTPLLYGNNEKFIYDKENNRVFKYDICEPLRKKIIEINGIYWHCKPDLYEANYYHKIKKMTADAIWEFDNHKINLAKKHEYEILIIWEDEYHKNPNETIKKCIQFLNEKDN